MESGWTLGISKQFETGRGHFKVVWVHGNFFLWKNLFRLNVLFFLRQPAFCAFKFDIVFFCWCFNF